MVFNFGKAIANTDTMTVKVNSNIMDMETLDCVSKAYISLGNFAWLIENYCNPAEILWEIAANVYEEMKDAECNDNPITEVEAIYNIAKKLNIELMEV